MKGCRFLTISEIEKIKDYFSRVINSDDDDKQDLQLRNYTLFFFSLYSGFRISETLSLKVKDVWEYGKVTSTVYLQKNNTKGKKSGRSGVINENCKTILDAYIKHYQMHKKDLDLPLFFSRQIGSLQSRQALNIFKKIFAECEIDGKVSTHTTRKTFSKIVYAGLGEDLLGLKSALGHSSISSTMSYIEANNEKVEKVLEKVKF